MYPIYILFLLSVFAHSQTISSVYPTRVTDGVTVTIEGSGFTDITRNSISFIGGGMDVQNKKIAPDGTRMFFDIGKSTTTLNPNPSSSATEDISRQLQLSINGALTPIEIANEVLLVTYIAPTAMIHAVAPYTENSRIRVNNRIEEIRSFASLASVEWCNFVCSIKVFTTRSYWQIRRSIWWTCVPQLFLCRIYFTIPTFSTSLSLFLSL